MEEMHLSMSLALILFLGIGAQWLAWRIRLPSILLLLLAGFVAGPILGWVSPDALLGEALMPLVSISVGLILFEGGLTLKFSELKATGSAVRNLISIGALVTWVGVTLAAKACLGWDWALSTLLGGILVVTGPTVIQPLLRHVRPSKAVGSALKWEGILIDPIGALLALLIFEAIGAHGEGSVGSQAVLSFGMTLLAGGGLGGLIAWLLVGLLRRYWIPDYLKSPVVFAAVVAVFVLANALQHESGLLAVTLMGVILANQKGVRIRQILEFKENLRVLLLSCLFILLSARLELSQLGALSAWGTSGFLLLLIFAVRPASVFASCRGTPFTRREKLFLSWMAPRGIVAAAVASVFAFRLESIGHPHASEIVPVVFVVIVGTVTLYGLTASAVAGWLGISRPNPQGVLIVGAGRVARALASALKQAGIAVLLTDTNAEKIRLARMEGLSTFYCNVLGEHSRDEMDLAGLGKVLTLTPNHEINTLAALHLAELFSQSEIYQCRASLDKAGKRTHSESHGREVFGMGVLEMERLLEMGYWIRSTKLGANFQFESWIQRSSGAAVPLCLISPQGKLSFLGEGASLKPVANDLLVGLVPTEPEQAAGTVEKVEATQDGGGRRET